MTMGALNRSEVGRTNADIFNTISCLAHCELATDILTFIVRVGKMSERSKHNNSPNVE